MPSDLTKLQWVRLQRSRKSKHRFFFAKNGFSQITLELRKLVTQFWQHRVPLAETHRNMYILTLKCQFQNLTLGQGHVKTPSRSYCISVEASGREKHIGTIPSALSLFYQKLEAKKRMCPHMTSNDPKERSFGHKCIRVIESVLI